MPATGRVVESAHHQVVGRVDHRGFPGCFFPLMGGRPVGMVFEHQFLVGGSDLTDRGAWFDPEGLIGRLELVGAGPGVPSEDVEDGIDHVLVEAEADSEILKCRFLRGADRAVGEGNVDGDSKQN